MRLVRKTIKIAKPSPPGARQFNTHQPNVVATVHTLAGLRAALRLAPGEVDVVELRVDALRDHEGELRRIAPEIKVPLLLTVRHPAEGGIGKLPLGERRRLIAEFLPLATLLDVELRSVRALDSEMATARAWGVCVVVSDHHFRATPPLARLFERQREALHAGADIFKIATLTPSAGELARLLEFIARPAAKPRAVMGMGAMGQVSRLALAKAGSVLNYGYLDVPNAPGQWEARELKRLLSGLA